VSTEANLNGFFDTMLEELSSLSCVDDKTSFARDRLVQRARKRARFNVKGLIESAINNFADINDAVGKTSITVDDRVLSNARYYITIVLERFTKSIYPEVIQTPLDLRYLCENWRFGPGASNGIKGSHTAEKLVQDMTCTARSVPLVRMIRDCNPYMFLNDEMTGLGTSVISGSRLTTVPKNEDTVRTIAIEPSGNMVLQLAAGAYLEGALRNTGLNIRDQQPKNKLMAKRGSIDGSFATIDLKSASDMISISLVRALMPSDWFDLLMAIRSNEMDLPDGRRVTLNMISTMGNGFTFPLMTLLLCGLIYGYRATRGGPSLYLDWDRTCVYGDDIIIPHNEYDDICDLLARAGLVVNKDKSYSDGPFRESCGGDYYEGYDVTPFYVKSLNTPAEIYVAMNQVLDWSARNNLFLYRSLAFLHRCLDYKVFLVPEWMNPDQGVLTARCSRRYSYLQVMPVRRRLRPSSYDMMLAVGGYLLGSDADLFYTPRTNRPRHKVRKSRLPQGYRDGSDPLKRSELLTLRVSHFIEILLG